MDRLEFGKLINFSSYFLVCFVLGRKDPKTGIDRYKMSSMNLLLGRSAVLVGSQLEQFYQLVLA